MAELFSLFGDVVSLKLERGDALMPTTKCSALVTLKSREEAQKARAGLNGKVVLPGMSPICVEFYNKPTF